LLRQGAAVDGPGRSQATSPSGGKTIKPEQTSCEKFLVLGKDVTAWGRLIEGYSKAGTVKEQTFERPITVVMNEGKKTPKETLWQKIKNGF